MAAVVALSAITGKSNSYSLDWMLSLVRLQDTVVEANTAT